MGKGRCWRVIGDCAGDQRHRPKTTVLYRLVERYWPQFDALLTERGRELPTYVREEFEGYLGCGRLEHGFVWVACGNCRDERLLLTVNGQVRYQLKAPYRDGTTFVAFERLDFIARLVALIPKPRAARSI